MAANGNAVQRMQSWEKTAYWSRKMLIANLRNSQVLLALNLLSISNVAPCTKSIGIDAVGYVAFALRYVLKLVSHDGRVS